jgi:hypothetical protein
LGKQKIAQVLGRAGLHLGTTTVGRILKEVPHRKPSEKEEETTTPSDEEVVYFHQRPANRSPRFEPRTLWPRSAPCAMPKVFVKGQPEVRLDLKVSYQHQRQHLPVATLRRAA